MKIFTYLILFTFLLFSGAISGQTCNGNTFSSPGAPATCTYSYTATGWEDQFGNPTTKPTSDILASESVCILADNAEALLNGGGNPKFNGTFYVAPGVTFSGSIPDFENATIVVEGTLNLSNLPDITDSSIYIDTTGTWNATGDFIIQQTSFLYNAGDINVGGNVELGGGSTNYIYPNASFIVQGNLNVNTEFYNCGLLEVVTGSLQAGGGSNLRNFCTTYVHNLFKLNNNYTNEGLLIVDGTLDFNGKNMTNEDTIIVENIVLNSNNLVGNYYSSILIVRNRSQLRNGASITGHYYFDMNNGGGFDVVCGFCVEDIIILDNVVVPSDPALLKADCGINIVLDFPFCKTIEDDNTIYGTVFNDYNKNGVYDSGEALEENITINLYSDLNSNGLIDGADSVVQTTVSNLNGQYTFGVTPTILLNEIFSKRVDLGPDDAQQEGNASVVINNAGYSFNIGDPFVGIRINDIDIPQRSNIKTAFIDFYSSDDQTGLLSYEISGQKIDNAQTFVAVNNNLSNRWDDNNKVSWLNIADWSQNTIYQTPNIKFILQDIVNRIGWERNNSMAFIFRHFAGDAERNAVSFEGDNTNAARLVVQYDAAEPASYIVQIDASTIPAGYSLTTPNNYAIQFPSVNGISCNNDFGYASACDDPSGTDTDGDGVNDTCDLDDDNDGILDVDECPDLGKPKIIDSDFEYVNIVSSGLDDGPTDAATTSTGIWKGDSDYYPFWESADSGTNHFEIWQNGNTTGSDPGGVAYSGIQWVELNASTDDGFYQDIATTPGDLLQWSFAHRKRGENIGSAPEQDIVDLLIGDPSGTMVSQGNFASADDASWTLHTGTYTVPVGQTTTRLHLTAISTIGSSGAGNHIDSVQLFVIPNCENTDGDTYPDYLDIDSDDDGIPDNVEAQATLDYVAPVGLVNSTSGLYPEYSGGLTLIDTDGDGIYDFRDSDSDSDGTPDIEENGMANLAGIPDSDNDGLKDVFETNGVSDASWDMNEDIEDPTDISILPDDDNDRFLGGDLNYRDLLDGVIPNLAKIDFDGIDDYIELKKSSPINSVDEFTISFWMKLDEVLTAPFPAKTFVGGQKDMFEVSVGLNASGDPYVWTTHYTDPGPSLSVGYPIDNINWFHYTAVVNYISESIIMYINGEQVNVLDITGNPRETNVNPFRLGSKLEVQPDPDFQNFNGWIDELRIFNSSLTASQIQQMTYQEIVNNSGIVNGSVIDKDILDPATKAIPWYNLVCYHPMNFIVSGDLIDSSLYGNNARLYNILSVEPQNAPLPYETQADGAWTTEATWEHGDVWDIEDIPNNKDWSIVHIHDNVTTNASHTQSGLLIDADKTLSVSGDNAITNNWYLQLDGTLDLADDSQLIQTENSDLVTSVTGKILRRQEGNSDVYWYNYWTSPVGTTGAATLSDNNGASNNTNNSAFNISMLKDGAGTTMQFTTAWDEIGKISNQWLYSFQNGITYYDWVTLTPATTISPGVGYTHKGTGNAGTEQQYIFEGKPNNGTILIAADDVDGDSGNESQQDVTLTTTLIGNPYPSALDADEFIRDNIDFDNGGANPIIQGTIFLWEQWAGSSHWLSEYEGGYGYINLTETARAYQHPDIVIADPTNPDNRGIKTPTKFIPVGQAFFVEVVNDGDIEFNNGQRVFKQESLNESVFFRGMQSQDDTENDEMNGRDGETTVTEGSSTENRVDEMQILRLEFGVSSGASRSFVLGFSDYTTDGFDYGYDGGLITNPPADDMGSILNGQQYVIQAFAPITPEKEVALVMHSSGNFTHTLKSTEITNIPESQALFIRDNETGNTYDLRSTEPYNFTSEAGTFMDRFEVIFTDPTLSVTNDILDTVVIFVDNKQDKLMVKGLDQDVKQMTITNMLGQTVKTFNNIENNALENGVHIGDLSSGVYLVNLMTEDNLKLNKKIIID